MTPNASARVVAVQDDLVEIELLDDPAGGRGALIKNEVVYICPSRANERGEQERLKAEVLRVRGTTADAQVYESTQGVAVGDAVEQSGRMLSVELGPSRPAGAAAQGRGTLRRLPAARRRRRRP